MYERFAKRTIDAILAAAALIVLAPILLLVAIAILLEDGAPAIFRQQRVGRDGSLFTIYKFRSMPVATPNVPSAAAGQLRVTRVGRFIRRTNLDELPQLWNVFRGDMSLIGPRPALPSQSSLVRKREEQGIHKVRPGLTGLAQVNSYDAMPEEEKVGWEARYIARISFPVDIGIVLKTFKYLARRPPAY